MSEGGREANGQQWSNFTKATTSKRDKATGTAAAIRTRMKGSNLTECARHSTEQQQANEHPAHEPDACPDAPGGAGAGAGAGDGRGGAGAAEVAQIEMRRG